MENQNANIIILLYKIPSFDLFHIYSKHQIGLTAIWKGQRLYIYIYIYWREQYILYIDCFLFEVSIAIPTWCLKISTKARNDDSAIQYTIMPYWCTSKIKHFYTFFIEVISLAKWNPFHVKGKGKDTTFNIILWQFEYIFL